MNTTAAVKNLIQDPLQIVGRLVPASRPALPYVEAAAWKAGHVIEELVEDEQGQTGISSELARLAIVVGLTVLVVGVVLWRAIFGLAEDTAADIEAAGSWGGG